MAETPEKVRPYEALGFDVESARISGKEVNGTCPFCGKLDKFYINTETGMFSCKAGHCGAQGNMYNYFEMWYKSVPATEEWGRLGAEKKISVETLKKAGFVHWRGTWYLPVRNKEGTIVNFRRYRYGGKFMGMPGIESFIWNLDELYRREPDELVYVCEGEWDAIALGGYLDEEGAEGIVLGIPGASVFKDSWVFPFQKRDVVWCYDNDVDGERGTKRAYAKLKEAVKSFSYVRWDSTMPDKYDMRDYVTTGPSLQELSGLIRRYQDAQPAPVPVVASKNGQATVEVDRRPELSGSRLHFDKVLETYKKYLHMTEELEWALKIIYATILSVQIEGDPLWVHIASVPGSGKTALLSSTDGCSSVHFESSLTPHSLVSGWQGKEGSDPSLIPRLTGKTLVLKDFTEILGMNRNGRDEIYSVLRGAFDGSVNKSYGNGLQRIYTDCHFHIVTGVTQEIYASGTASLGERFLIYHQVKGVGFDADKQIEAALRNVKRDDTMRDELREVATAFLDYTIPEKDVPDLSDAWTARLVGLSQFVSMLRAQVPRGFGTDRLAYRAQHEMGTRVAKQLKKLLLGLSMLHYPMQITPEDYRIVVRVAMDTCIGFNLEITSTLLETDGMTADEISESASIPLTTCRECLADLEQLGVVRREKNLTQSVGRPQFSWWLTDTIEKHWIKAELMRHVLTRDMHASAKRNSQVSRIARIKRAGSGETREYVEEAGVDTAS